MVAPPSKSAAHRAILCAALSNGVSHIQNVAYSQDILATIDVVRALGAEVTQNEDSVTVKGAPFDKAFVGQSFFCNESGSTLRFMIPIALSMGGTFRVSGAGRLMERPLDDYFRICDEKSITYQKQDGKITFSGKLTPGEYYLSGDVSSQYITGLLLALPMLSGDSKIHITTPVESLGYLKMTIDMMQTFGVTIRVSEDFREYTILGNQCYQAKDVVVEGDYSQAAFFLVANEMGSNIFVKGLDLSSKQGDKDILNIIRTMREETPVHTIDVSQVPDLVPILSVLAAKSNGMTHIVGAKRLRLKESDRLHAVATELTKLGVTIKEQEDSLEIQGNCSFTGGKVDSYNDHRIAMSLAIAATVAEDKVEISGADSVKKSYADFWDVFKKLGGVIA